ncbi:uncharacterized protein LOC102382065 [Alligator sinensis]|uniref:Uncharacterized protein LOC102382065 n=1 Tax=Alligator sinensis TaxID=38654 RepID=A0A3Q0GHK5_ALLSI|nr:uncharacterized protein LOC102382065 [Alligator sinensis]
MTPEELYLEYEEVNKLTDELQAAIQSYKGHLSKLAPQLQAEQEQCTSYIYQHIKRLPANTGLPQGLQLKVHENGKDTGEILVYVNKQEIENCRNQPSALMERLLHTIHQRLQYSADFKSSGLNCIPAQLFDEKGQEIKNPLLLKNEQKIWFSYGKDYRSPLNCVLSLTFDKVTAAEKDGITVIYKSLPDHNADLLPGFDKKAYMSTSLFLSENKGDWCSAGMILNRAMVQSCLAVGQPIRVEISDGVPLEGCKLAVQQRYPTTKGQKKLLVKELINLQQLMKLLAQLSNGMLTEKDLIR